MPGEAVVPTRLVPAVAPFLSANRVPGFASGGIVGSYAGGAGGLQPWAAHNVTATNQSLFTSMANAITSAIHASIRAKMAAYTASHVSGYGAGVAQWRPDVLHVLGMLGLPFGDAATILSQIGSESGGNPNAINLTDSNAAAGIASRGLLQVIPPTFAAYRNRSLSSNIYDPLANIYAGVNYAIHRYGNPGFLSVLGHGHGYDSGGLLPTGLSLAYNGTGRPEQVTPARGGGQKVVLQIQPTGTSAFDRFMADWLADAARVRGGGSLEVAFGNHH